MFFCSINTTNYNRNTQKHSLSCRQFRSILRIQHTCPSSEKSSTWRRARLARSLALSLSLSLARINKVACHSLARTRRRRPPKTTHPQRKLPHQRNCQIREEKHLRGRVENEILSANHHHPPASQPVYYTFAYTAARSDSTVNSPTVQTASRILKRTHGEPCRRHRRPHKF